MKIIVDRVSVSAGDDTVPYKTEYEVSEEMTVGAFFAFLEEDSYLPLVQGNDVAWELRNINGEQGAYFTKTKETLQADALLKTMIEGANGDNQFELIYHSTPEAYFNRKEKT